MLSEKQLNFVCDVYNSLVENYPDYMEDENRWGFSRGPEDGLDRLRDHLAELYNLGFSRTDAVTYTRLMDQEGDEDHCIQQMNRIYAKYNRES